LQTIVLEEDGSSGGIEKITLLRRRSNGLNEPAIVEEEKSSFGS